MKRLRIWLYAISALLICSCAACGKQNPESGAKQEEKQDETKPAPTQTEFTLSIMSFNIAVDNRQEDKGWNWRRDAVVKMLKQERPLVIGLQEAQAHEITYLVKHGPSYVRYGLGRDTGKAPKQQDDYDSEETMLIMWDPAALDATEKGTFWLSETPDKPGKGWDADYNRNVNWVRFYHKGTGLSFYYFNTHLDNKGSVARTESMKLIAERIKSINKENLPVFLSADFNAKPNNAIFAPIRDWMKSARNEAPESESVKNTFNGYNAPKSQIDHIFFCGDKVSAQTFRVLDGDYGATWISDHYPIVATFNYKK